MLTNGKVLLNLVMRNLRNVILLMESFLGDRFREVLWERLHYSVRSLAEIPIFVARLAMIEDCFELSLFSTNITRSIISSLAAGDARHWVMGAWLIFPGSLKFRGRSILELTLPTKRINK